MRQVVVVGGGAAGIFGAIACAEADPDVRVMVLEAGPHSLSKVKISGGGRCNVTHACFDPAELVTHYPRGHRALRGPFSQFQPRDTVDWFTRRGVSLKTEQDGRMFPTTDSSQTIIDCLLESAHRHRISIRTRTPVVSVDSDVASDAGFWVQLKSGEKIACDRLLLATGSHPTGYRIAASLGHTIDAPVPSLFTFTIPDPRLRELAGIAVDPVCARLMIEGKKPMEQSGPLLVTHWGMSGPAILKLSAWAARDLHDCRYNATLQVNWLPALNQQAIRDIVLEAKERWSRKAIATTTPVPMPRRFWRYVVIRAAVDPQLRWADFSKKALHRLGQTLTQDRYTIAGKGAFKDEFVTCGGIPLKEVNFRTMESRRCPNLFFAGEILDIDGVTGGFNFQNAWTTGWLAGQGLAI